MTWKNKPTKFNVVVKGLVSESVREIALDGLAQNIQRSPVRTGRYKNNHNIGVGDIDTSTRGADGSGSGSFSQGSKLSILNDFPVVFISNNLPYSQKIEDGISRQAESGVYRPTYTFLAQKYKRIVK